MCDLQRAIFGQSELDVSLCKEMLLGLRDATHRDGCAELLYIAARGRPCSGIGSYHAIWIRCLLYVATTAQECKPHDTRLHRPPGLPAGESQPQAQNKAGRVSRNCVHRPCHYTMPDSGLGGSHSPFGACRESPGLHYTLVQ